jgi:hypothetical protein
MRLRAAIFKPGHAVNVTDGENIAGKFGRRRRKGGDIGKTPERPAGP